MFKAIQKCFLLTLLLILVQTKAFANERWYKVELLIMEHKDKSGILLEEWPIDPGYPSVSDATSIQTLDEAENIPGNFVELTNNEYDLNDAKQSLVKRTGNKILLHKAWRQKVIEDQAEPIRLHGGKSYSYTPQGESRAFELTEFDGTFTVLLSRYLHVDTDLVFHKPMQILAKDSSYAHDNLQRLKPLSNEANWEGKKDVDLQRFRFNEKRKIRKNEVMYIDHPLYGVMIKISDDKRAS